MTLPNHDLHPFFISEHVKRASRAFWDAVARETGRTSGQCEPADLDAWDALSTRLVTQYVASKKSEEHRDEERQDRG